VITVLGRIVVGHRQLAASGSLREPAQLDYACPDQDVPRERMRSASHGVAVRHFWRWCGHSAMLGRHCNAYEFARLDFLRRRLGLFVVDRYRGKADMKCSA
jgi:hypothetical protein